MRTIEDAAAAESRWAQLGARSPGAPPHAAPSLGLLRHRRARTPALPAEAAPRRGVLRRRGARAVRPHDPPAPTYAFGYRNAPISGNEINGLGSAGAHAGEQGLPQPRRWGDALGCARSVLRPDQPAGRRPSHLREHVAAAPSRGSGQPASRRGSGSVGDERRDQGEGQGARRRPRRDHATDATRRCMPAPTCPIGMPSASACGWTGRRCASFRNLGRPSRCCGCTGPSPGSRSSWASTSGSWAGRRERTATPTARTSFTSLWPSVPVSASSGSTDP